MATKLIRPDQLAQHIIKKQGDKKETEFAVETGLFRQTIRRFKSGKSGRPQALIDALDKLGIEMFYRDKQVPVNGAGRKVVKKK
jgi:hypothetical protein